MGNLDKPSDTNGTAPTAAALPERKRFSFTSSLPTYQIMKLLTVFDDIEEIVVERAEHSATDSEKSPDVTSMPKTDPNIWRTAE